MTLFAWPSSHDSRLRFVLWLLAGLLVIAMQGARPAIANMANPEQPGDLLTEPWADVADLDIQHEDLILDLRSLADGLMAEITATYQIYNPGAATTVPLLFVTPGLKMGGVMLDDQQAIAAASTDAPVVPEAWNPREFFQPLRGLRFDVPLGSGEHSITVNYQGLPSRNDVDLYRQYILEYWLAPALQWRSFGTLTVDVFAPANWETMLTPDLTLIEPGHWQQTFEGLPSDVLTVNARPLLSPRIHILRIVCRVGGVAIAFVATFGLYHWLGRLSQRQNWSGRWLVIRLLLVIPFSMPLFWGCGALGIWAAESLIAVRHLAMAYTYSRLIFSLLLSLAAMPTGFIVAILGFYLGRCKGTVAIAPETT